MEITVLVDNMPHPQRIDLQVEHGLAFYIEVEGLNILCDMGASPFFISNASALGVRMTDIDVAVLSHAHADHSGGLGAFMLANSTARVTLAPSVFSRRYYSSRRGAKRDISADASLLDANPHRFIFFEESYWLGNNVAVVRNVVDENAKPLGNAFLTMAEQGTDRPDDFAHEISLAFCTTQGLVIVSSCSHNGALNIIESCRRFTGVDKVAAFVGGLHFVDGENAAEETQTFVQQWKQRYPEMKVFTGHCTGSISRQVLSSVYNCYFFHTGHRISL